MKQDELDPTSDLDAGWDDEDVEESGPKLASVRERVTSSKPLSVAPASDETDELDEGWGTDDELDALASEPVGGLAVSGTAVDLTADPGLGEQGGQQSSRLVGQLNPSGFSQTKAVQVVSKFFLADAISQHQGTHVRGFSKDSCGGIRNDPVIPRIFHRHA